MAASTDDHHSDVGAPVAVRCIRLLDLPRELLEHAARALLTRSAFASLLRCRQTCSRLHHVLDLLSREVEARRLQFDAALCVGQELRADRRSLTVAQLEHGENPGWADIGAWAVCGALPTRGRSRWQVRIDHSGGDDGACMVVGVPSSQ